MASRKKQLFSNETVPIVIFFILFGLIIVVFSLMHEHFLSVRNISTLLKHASISAIFALGVTFVVVVGHFDLSFPMVCALAGMTNSFLIAEDIHVVLSVAAGLAVGVFFCGFEAVATDKGHDTVAFAISSVNLIIEFDTFLDLLRCGPMIVIFVD